MNASEFENIFRELYSPLCRYVFLLVHDKDIAEDIVQDQFVYLWNKRDSLNIKSYKDYLFRSAKNKAINHLKSYHHKNTQTLTDSTSETQVTNDTNEWLDHMELQELIRNALAQLPERCHTVFYLKRFEGLSSKEIAKELSISVKTVENQMTIAIKKISKFLEDHWQ